MNKKNNIMKNEVLNNLLDSHIKKPSTHKSMDIWEHLNTLKEYGSKCNTITEMGVRWGSSTIAFLNSDAEEIISYDIVTNKDIQNIENIVKETKINHKFIIADSLKIDIKETDLLFIDTLHTYNQLLNELNLHSKNVKKYIILHDTTTFGRRDEKIYPHASNIVKKEKINKVGLRTAMEDFLKNNNNWKIEKDYKNNNGLTILKRV